MQSLPTFQLSSHAVALGGVVLFVVIIVAAVAAILVIVILAVIVMVLVIVVVVLGLLLLLPPLKLEVLALALVAAVAAGPAVLLLDVLGVIRHERNLAVIVLHLFIKAILVTGCAGSSLLLAGAVPGHTITLGVEDAGALLVFVAHSVLGHNVVLAGLVHTIT